MMSIGLRAQDAVFTHVIDVGIGYVSRVELPVQRRLCPDFCEKCRVIRHSRVFPRVDG